MRLTIQLHNDIVSERNRKIQEGLVKDFREALQVFVEEEIDITINIYRDLRIIPIIKPEESELNKRVMKVMLDVIGKYWDA